MAEDKVQDLHGSNVKEVIQRLHDRRHEIGTLVVVGIQDDGEIVAWFAHDGDPQPHLLLGGMADAQDTVIQWMRNYEP